MSTFSQLILPPKNLASCIAGCIVRDTRTMELSLPDRVNYFPASPLYSITLTIEGQIHLSDKFLAPEDMIDQPVAPKRLFQAPKDAPHMSWNPGPLLAMTIAIFPDAWLKLGGTLKGEAPEDIQHILPILETQPIEVAWPKFCAEMALIWHHSKEGNQVSRWVGSDRVRDWTHHLFAQIAHSGPSRSIRTLQRRLQRWTGFTRKELEFYSKVEEVHRIITTEPAAHPVDIASDAGFSDQSHMGRAIKRATGFSPVSLNQKIAIEEPFWCYRLLGERF